MPLHTVDRIYKVHTLSGKMVLLTVYTRSWFRTNLWPLLIIIYTVLTMYQAHLLGDRVQNRLDGLGMEDRHSCRIASSTTLCTKKVDPRSGAAYMRMNAGGSISSPIYAVNYIIGIHVMFIKKENCYFCCVREGEPAKGLSHPLRS